MKIALLTCANLDQYITYEDHLNKALEKENIQYQWIDWKNAKEIDWVEFDGALIRTTWDYQAHYKEFIEALEYISAQTKLWNPIDIVKWNSSKDYLNEFINTETPPVPNIKIHPTNISDIESCFEKFNCNIIIIKPFISAGSHDTFRIERDAISKFCDQIFEAAGRKKMMAQPFLENINLEGEFSLHFFDGEFSHAILKTPKEGDFRSQEEFGSNVQSIVPTEEQLHYAKKVLSHIRKKLLYARVDFVRGGKDYYLMELELIEPSLYFNFDLDSADRLVKKILKRLN